MTAHNPGLIRIKQDELDETVWRYHEQGMRCCMHAIGDVALDMVLEAYEKALRRPAGPPPPRRAHGQLDDDAGADRAGQAARHPADGQPVVPVLPRRSAGRYARRCDRAGLPDPHAVGRGFPALLWVRCARLLARRPAARPRHGRRAPDVRRPAITAGEGLTMREALRAQTANAA